ncbi:MAG: alpha,alpha-trehalase TreF [Bacteroidota bacterium]
MSLSIEQLSALFEAVQFQNVLGDGKTFPDCVPKKGLASIQKEYDAQKNAAGFDLKKFVHTHFDLPPAYASDFKSDPTRSAAEHIKKLWDYLTRQPAEEQSSLIALPHPYVVPGGRFREIYYWDSYFTMLGLRISGREDLIDHMVNNFAFLIDRIGYIPNGNRSYFVGRSQPPFFSLMVKLWSERKGNALTKFLPQLSREYQFWMRGADSLSTTNALHRVVCIDQHTKLNRYWDENDTPRPEAYKEDVELSHRSTQPAAELFRHLRAAAESGWDFSSRWFKDPRDFSSIHTTDIVPVDLNCLLYHLEHVLAVAYGETGDSTTSQQFSILSEKRKAAIQKYCWNEEVGFFFDYDFQAKKQKTQRTLAALFPLFFQIAESGQAKKVASIVEQHFLKTGGVTTTLEFSGQQWDAPNGWAPLQWITYKGLMNYGFAELANRVRTHWITANEKVYASTGKMTEKYDVWNENGAASGGEYPNQDGFGWTNGVYLALKENS